jgi:hypothetical protein
VFVLSSYGSSCSFRLRAVVVKVLGAGGGDNGDIQEVCLTLDQDFNIWITVQQILLTIP